MSEALKLGLLDVETTGLDEKKHRVVECCLQVLEFSRIEPTIKVLDSLYFKHSLFLDKKRENYAEIALKINGYNHEPGGEWAGMPDVNSYQAFENWSRFNQIAKDVILTSQNVNFDKEFIKSEMARFSIEPSWNRRSCDLTTLSILIQFFEHGQEKFGLHDVYNTLGFPKLPEHRAKADVERGLAILKYSINKFRKNK